MERTRKAIIAFGIAMILGAPVFGFAMAAPVASVPASIMHHQELLTLTLMPPLAQRTSWYGGAVIPLLVSVWDENENSISNATVTVWVNGFAATSPGHTFMGNTMKYAHGSVYFYLLATKPYPAGPGSSPIVITIQATTPDDFFGGSLTVSVSLR